MMRPARCPSASQAAAGLTECVWCVACRRLAAARTTARPRRSGPSSSRCARCRGTLHTHHARRTTGGACDGCTGPTTRLFRVRAAGCPYSSRGRAVCCVSEARSSAGRAHSGRSTTRVCQTRVNRLWLTKLTPRQRTRARAKRSTRGLPATRQVFARRRAGRGASRVRTHRSDSHLTTRVLQRAEPVPTRATSAGGLVLGAAALHPPGGPQIHHEDEDVDDAPAEPAQPARAPSPAERLALPYGGDAFRQRAPVDLLAVVGDFLHRIQCACLSRACGARRRVCCSGAGMPFGTAAGSRCVRLVLCGLRCAMARATARSLPTERRPCPRVRSLRLRGSVALLPRCGRRRLSRRTVGSYGQPPSPRLVQNRVTRLPHRSSTRVKATTMSKSWRS
jgi:hypothetical protein